MRTGLRFKLISSLVIVAIVPILILGLVGSMDSGNSGAGNVMYTNIMIGITTLILILVGISVMLAKIISRDILVPLKELSTAADNIVRGDYEFRVAYRGNNEMGRFSEAFEVMRSKLQESLEQQRLSEQARKELITTISHDLRTPLSSIKGYVEGLQDGIVHDKAKYERYLAIIKNKTVKLDSLIEELFQITQLESGHLIMQAELENSQELLEDLIRPFELEFMDLNAELIVHRPFPALPVRADRARIAQVFDNLLGNALKYADAGESSITISAEMEASFLRIRVGDNGSGIAEEDLPHIFDRFYRGDKSRSSKYGGSGLGLFICKKIIEVHGGTISVRSRLGAGSLFEISLPVVETAGR
jgi:signal transduction histidine kinase